MSKGIVVTFFLITQSEASVFNFSVFNGSIEHNIELLVIPIYLQSTFLLLNATANDMGAKTEKS